MDHEYKEPYQLKLKKLKEVVNLGYHDVNCPKCSTSILGDGININDKIAKCDACGVVFSFEKEISQLTSSQRIKQEIIRPEGIDMFRFQNELDFTFQQSYSGGDGLLSFLSVLFAPLSTLIYAKVGGNWIIPTVILWIMLAYAIYTWFQHKKNKVHVNIDERFINIQWRPKKGKKDQSFDRTDIDQLYVKMVPGMSRYGVYMIVNGLEGQKHILLIPNISGKSKALYVEQEIEKHLGIIDREVLEETV